MCIYFNIYGMNKRLNDLSYGYTIELHNRIKEAYPNIKLSPLERGRI